MKKLILIFLFLPLLNIAQIQYTMPFEDSQHEGTWLQWPHNFTYPPWWQEDNEPAFIEMVAVISRSRSAKVDFPWSICAIMQKLRIWFIFTRTNLIRR